MNSRHAIAAALVIALGVGCSEDDPVFDNPFDPRNGDGLPVPTAVDALVGSNLLRLSWQLPEGESADEYAVFRQRMDEPETGERLVARVKSMSYDDMGVRNGSLYAYRIAAGRDGRFGPRSEVIEARPNVVSIIIADDAPKTRFRTVSLAATAPSAVTVKLSENPDPSGAQPRSLGAALTWTLSGGDGDKQVYAVFQFDDGSKSITVMDSIVLDTRAVIRSVTFDEPSVRKPGDVIHFFLDAGEPNGNASVQVTGLFDTPVSLFDDGTSGDAVADNGIYELDVVIPGRTVSNATVRGRFTDEAGNEAAALDGSKLLSVQESPEAVELIATETAEPPDAASVTLRWTQFRGMSFASYKVFRSESAPVDSSKKLVGTVANVTTLELTDSDVVEGRSYHYRVYVSGTGGLMSGSNTVQLLVPNVRPPAAVTLEPVDAVGPNSVVVRWSRSADLDFAAYRLYRNESGAVSENDSLVTEITDVDQTFWDDVQLSENTTYHYRLFTVDNANLVSRSNEVEATTTENVVPDAVTLLPATLVEPPEPPGVMLRWTQSNASQFVAYRVVRADAFPVEPTDEIVGRITSQATLEFTDDTVFESHSYAYRIFVLVDSREQSGSNTLEVDVPNLRAPTAATLQPPDAASSNRLAIEWNVSPDTDFLRYILFRNETGAVNESDLQITSILERDQTFYDDTGLVENTTYYYRLYTSDTGGLSARSNEVMATTRNEPPPGVSLSIVASDSTTATLTWDESTAHDFAAYRLYRDRTTTVTTNSTLVVEIDESDITTYRDTGLDSGTEYSYRIFVVDDGVDPGPGSTGSNTVTLTTN